MTNFLLFAILCKQYGRGEIMLEIITPSAVIGPLGLDFFEGSLKAKDKLVCQAIDTMIGFRILGEKTKSFYVGDLTEDRQLQFMHHGAYETRRIEPEAQIFYEKPELLIALCEEFFNITQKKLTCLAIK